MTKPIRFEMADLKLYVAIIEQGSLSKAAKALPLALSATSARLKALEDRLEVQLVERRARGVKATVAGEHFYDHAVRLVKAAQEAQIEMDAISGKGRLRIKLSSNITGLSTELPRQLSEFLQQNPNMDIDLVQQASRDAHHAVASGRADLAIVDRDYTKQELLYLLYQRNQLVVIANSGNPLAQLEQCRFVDWLEQPLVGLESESSLQKFLQRMAIIAHKPASIRATAPNFNAIAELISKDIGVAIVPRPIALRLCANPQLDIKIIQLNEAWSERELYICIRPQTDIRLPALKLARFLAG